MQRDALDERRQRRAPLGAGKQRRRGCRRCRIERCQQTIDLTTSAVVAAVLVEEALQDRDDLAAGAKQEIAPSLPTFPTTPIQAAVAGVCKIRPSVGQPWRYPTSMGSGKK